MVLLRGANTDTGGSSGAGKTTPLLAISYLLGFCPYAGTALQSWHSEEPMEVSGTFALDAGPLVVTRGQKLALSLNGEKVPGSAKQLEEKLAQLLGLPSELLAALTYRGQKQPGLFLSKTDSEKKEFLTTLLGLGRFEAAVEKSQAQAKNLETWTAAKEMQLGSVRSRLETARASLTAPSLTDEAALKSQLLQTQALTSRLKTQLEQVSAKIKAKDAQAEATIKARAEAAQADLETLRAEVEEFKTVPVVIAKFDKTKLDSLSQDLGQARSFLAVQVDAERQAKTQHEAEVSAAAKEWRRLEVAQGQLQQKLRQLQEKAAGLADGSCSTCHQPWQEALAEKSIAEEQANEAVTELEKLAGAIAQLREAAAAPGPAHNTTIDELKDVISHLEKQIAAEEARVTGEAKVAMAEFRQRKADAEAVLATFEKGIAQQVTSVRSQALEATEAMRDERDELERQLRTSESAERGFEQALSRVAVDNARETERHQLQQKQLEGIEKEHAHLDEELAGVRKNLAAELDFQKLIGREGFLGSIFDEVLAEISEETNRLLAQLPNASHVVLTFKSESQTQKGTVKRSIVPFVVIGGYEAPLASGLSGGMTTAVELAVDLAVAGVVSRRTGSSPGWLILDEAFTGLGPVEAEAGMEILKAFADDKLVLVVDHSSELKSMFSEIIDIHYANGRSTVRST
jgi:DNA repair exonuclease SbcCD ATPase subunit